MSSELVKKLEAEADFYNNRGDNMVGWGLFIATRIVKEHEAEEAHRKSINLQELANEVANVTPDDIEKLFLLVGSNLTRKEKENQMDKLEEEAYSAGSYPGNEYQEGYSAGLARAWELLKESTKEEEADE